MEHGQRVVRFQPASEKLTHPNARADDGQILRDFPDGCESASVITVNRVVDRCEAHEFGLSHPTRDLPHRRFRQFGEYALTRFRDPQAPSAVGFAHDGCEKALAACPVRIEAECADAVRLSSLDAPLRSRPDVDRPFAVVLRGEPADVLLVLGRVERAGAVYQRASGTERVPCFAQNAPLPGRAQLGSRLAPLPSRLAVLAEHALARAGRVDQNQVEVVPERSETGRIGARYDDIPDPPPPDVVGQDRRSGADRLVRDDQALGTGKARKKRRLASGSRAQVEYPQRRSGIGYGTENSLQKHRARLLHVVSSAVQRRVERK